MLVEYGCHGIQALAKLCEAFRELDGFGSFISGLEALSEHRNYLSFFGDAAQFERREFDFPSPHNSESFVA
jgi:hypothetical protein